VEGLSYRAISDTKTFNQLINASNCVKGGKKGPAKHQISAIMCKSDPKLDELPDVLQDLVLMFAFNVPKSQVVESLDVILSIIDMDLPFFFFRTKIWSWHYNRYLSNPVFRFMPIEYYNGRYSEIFDDDAMFCLLIGLDFRRKNVRMFGSRQKWLDRIVTTWRCVEPLAAYYRMLLRTRAPIMKKRGPLVTMFV
jgi:hypothetical protein